MPPSQSLPLTLFALFNLHVATALSYTLPQHASLPLVRALAVDATRAGFNYGAAVAGGPYYPTGLLGDAKVAVDVATEQTEALPEIALTAEDGTVAAATSGKVCIWPCC